MRIKVFGDRGQFHFFQVSNLANLAQQPAQHRAFVAANMVGVVKSSGIVGASVMGESPVFLGKQRNLSY